MYIIKQNRNYFNPNLFDSSDSNADYTRKNFNLIQVRELIKNLFS